jgi:hypothetical protein
VPARSSGRGDACGRNCFYVYMTLEGLYYSESWPNVWKATSEEILKLPMGGLRMKQDVQLSICSRTEEDHAETWSRRQVARPSLCRLTDSQQPGLIYANHNASPYLRCCCFILTNSLYMNTNQRVVCNICEENTCLYAHTCVRSFKYLVRTSQRTPTLNTFRAWKCSACLVVLLMS